MPWSSPMRRLPLALLLLAAPAAAQDRPPLTPTRDVAVTYRLLGGGPQAGQQAIVIAWNAQLGAMRSDMPGGMGWMVADPRQGRAFMVMEQQRMVMDLPVGQVMQQHMNSPTATFRREGSATVAGLPCTIWAVEDRGNRGRSCVTADGVPLRAEGTAAGGQSGGMEATQVTFGPQDPARFQRPQGYQAMQMPQGMPPGARQPGAAPK
jgi:hypothetical protein